VLPTTGGEWITTTPDGYFEGSANPAPLIRWNVDGVLYPAAAYWDVYYRPDRVRQALRVPGRSDRSSLERQMPRRQQRLQPHEPNGIMKAGRSQSTG
jgi:hypothetical protein